MYVRRRLLPVAFVALLAWAIPGATAGRGAEEPVLNLYLSRLGTGKVTRLTANRHEEAGPQSPSWAPDGRRLAFSFTQCESCRPELRLLDISARAHPHSQRIGFGRRPRWSRDGKTIAFVSANGNLFLKAAGTGGKPRLVRTSVSPDGASWAPDSRKLVVVLRSSTGTYRIEILSLRGRTIRRLVKSSTPLADPAWSPNGREVVFARQRPNGQFQLYVVRLPGRSVRRLASASFSETSPSWNRDGSKLAFVGSEAGRTAVYVMAWRGGRPQRITPTSLFAMQPDWSPRGPLVVFAARP